MNKYINKQTKKQTNKQTNKQSGLRVTNILMCLYSVKSTDSTQFLKE